MKNWDKVPNQSEFMKWRENWLESITANESQMNQIHTYIKELDKLKNSYLWDWCGVPIIRHPSDIVLVQEFLFKFRPTLCIEIGVARGGGVVLYSSLMKMMGIEPNVFGVDIKIHPHTYEAIKKSKALGIRLLEAPSTSDTAQEQIRKELEGHNTVFVTLDANHQHEYVLNELRMFDEFLPRGSVILVCDTIADQLIAEEEYEPRNGQKGDSPKTALDAFLAEKNHWEKLREFNNKSHFGESPLGWIVRV